MKQRRPPGRSAPEAREGVASTARQLTRHTRPDAGSVQVEAPVSPASGASRSVARSTVEQPALGVDLVHRLLAQTWSGAWAGVFNTHFWVDRAGGVTGAIYTQFLPFIPEEAMAVYADFERAVYASR